MDIPNVETGLPKAVLFTRGRNFAFNVHDLRCLAVVLLILSKLILELRPRPLHLAFSILVLPRTFKNDCYLNMLREFRSEERRVGKECSS